MSLDILEVFAARRGMIALVGAGGKKSTIHRLVNAHPGRAAVTSTVFTPPFRRRLGAHPVVARDADELCEHIERALGAGHTRLAYALASDKTARLAGVPPEHVATIHARFGFDATFVKADGARLRWIKAPDRGEPVLPEGTSVVIPVVSIRAVGKPLSHDIAHRPEGVARVMKMRIGERITTEHLARLLASGEGALKDAGDARVVPVINMAERREDLRLARLVAEQAMAQCDRIDRIVIASMVRDDPLLQVVDR